jgi:hypothetical protein
LDEAIHIPTYEETYMTLYGKPFEGKVSSAPGMTTAGNEISSPTRTRTTTREATKSDNKCPSDLEFGISIGDPGKKKICDECQIWDDCRDEEKRLAEIDAGTSGEPEPKKETPPVGKTSRSSKAPETIRSSRLRR